jgi:methionyl-tRNA synthetase
MNKFYITTAIAYVNAAPHIGFALELCQADALARYNRIQKKDVYFLTGTDEHGTKIEQTARELGMSPQDMADKNSELVRELANKLEISNDDYVRTTSEIHKRGAQKFWNLISHKIYEKEYEGLYCVGCESFIPEKIWWTDFALFIKAPQN